MALRTSKLFLGLGVSAAALGACADARKSAGTLPPASATQAKQAPTEQYVIGAYDELTISVWRNPELGAKIQVRPDGRITMPLVTDMPAVGKTPTMLAADIKLMLSKYIDNPLVSVIVSNFSGNYSQQVRIIGASEKPASIPFRAGMTLLDAMTEVGLSQYAAGNKARLIRFDKESGTRKEYAVKIGNLMKHGDLNANVQLQPGDVITIPQSMF